MRPIFFSDVSAAARVLLPLDEAARAGVCRQMIAQARCAARHIRRTGQLHPRWGNGTLRAVALQRRPGPEPGFDDPAYCRCFGLVLAQLHGVAPDSSCEPA